MPRTRINTKMDWQWMVYLLAGFLLAGCAGGISRQAKSQITYTGAFTRLQQSPQQHVGQVVLLGGRIIATINEKDATELVVLQLPLSGSDIPMDNDQSQGRFRILAQGFLDPAIYSQGELITVVGRVTGERVDSIGAMDYRYPLLTPIEIKKWSPTADAQPRFHFGFGMGTSF